MVEKGSEQSDTSKSPSTPEQLVARTYSVQSARSSSKNSKVRRGAGRGRVGRGRVWWDRACRDGVAEQGVWAEQGGVGRCSTGAVAEQSGVTLQDPKLPTRHCKTHTNPRTQLKL